MLWVYDDAIVKDIQDSFDKDEYGNSVVSVVDPENVLSIAAQVQEDKIHYPVIALSRPDTIPIDTDLVNFTRMHKGVATVFDKEKNNIYYEKAVPIKLQYEVVGLGTRTADIDELIRELFFKYTQQYFITIQIPYESKRKIRCGLRVNIDDGITWYSKSSNYLEEGKLHSAGFTLYVDGAVMVTYTPEHLRRLDTSIGIENPKEVSSTISS